MLVFYLYGWLSSPCVVGTHRGQKRVLESLGAELWRVVSHCVVTENRKPVHRKSNQY